MARVGDSAASLASAPVLDLQSPASFEQRLLVTIFLDPFRALRQRRLVEQSQERGEPLAVDQPEDLDVALRGRAPAGNVERPLCLGEEPVIAHMRAAALWRPARHGEPARPPLWRPLCGFV